MIGKPLRAYLTKLYWKQSQWPVLQDMVIVDKIGQSAGKESKSIIAGHDSPSTTQRILVNNDELATLNSLKI